MVVIRALLFIFTLYFYFLFGLLGKLGNSIGQGKSGKTEVGDNENPHTILSVLTAIFQVNRCSLKQRMMDAVVTTGLLELQVVQSSSQIITTNKPTPSFFYRPDALPVAQSAVSRH